MSDPLRGASLDEARAAWSAMRRAAGCAEAMPVVEVPLVQALGSRLALSLAARRSSPPVRCAAMDGIAVRATETARAGPHTPVALAADHYQRVDTGAVIEERFDAVVAIEQVTIREATASVTGRARPGQHVRAVGEDISAGAPVLSQGALIGPVEIAAAAASGYASLPVPATPRVAIIPTGNEIIGVAGGSDATGVIDADGPMLAAQTLLCGARPHVHEPVPDQQPALARALQDAAAQAQLVVLVAGTSRGRRDYAAAVIADAGRLAVHGVAIRPGHPVALGVAHGVPVIAVPGYPLAASVAFHAFASPVLAGLGHRRLQVRQARLAADVSAPADATRLVLVRVEEGQPARAHPAIAKAGVLRQALGVNGVMRIAPGQSLVAGESISVEAFAAR